MSYIFPAGAGDHADTHDRCADGKPTEGWTEFTSVEIIGPMVGFATLGLLALWVMIILRRKTVETTKRPAVPLPAAQSLARFSHK